MEHMDISYGDVNPGGTSDMICDEEMHECSGHNIVQEYPQSTAMIEPYLPDSGNIETAMIGNAASTTILLNSSFPTDNGENVSESIRFPLQYAKDSNISNIIPTSNNTIEVVKTNLLNTPANIEHMSSDKENMFTENCETWSDEFPIIKKGQNNAFPLDVIEFSPVQLAVQPEELFTPANEYNFSAADFDCLLSRGCTQSTKSTVTSTAASASPSSEAVLPRNSVLINFDPLLRRQTIIKAENRVSNSITESPSACYDLANFAQQQRSNGSADPIPVIDASSIDSSGLQATDSAILLDALNQSSLSLSVNLIGTESRDKQNQEEVSCCLLDSFLAANHPESQDLSEDSFEKTVVLHESETKDCSRLVEHLLLSSPSAEQEKYDGEKENNNEPIAAVLNYGKDSEQLLEHTSILESTTDSNPNSKVAQSEEFIVEQFHNTNLNSSLSAKQTKKEVNIKQPAVKLNRTDHLPGAVIENNDLITYCGNMIAEPYLGKQSSAVQSMSEERSVPIEEGCVEAGKKCKNEEVNIADIEKKMHDVELREESMLKRITEKDKIISKMSNVVEAYERTIAELISEKEILIRNHQIECESLKQDNEINAQHLESLEKTFSNLYAKYERMKKNALKYKDNEEKLLEKVLKFEECLRAQEQRYEKMKSHAMSQLEIANTKIDEAIRNHSQESAKLKAQIKKEELYRISINEQLIQKSKENEELVKICDELISETN